jgi:hypothetical protein
MVIFRSAHDLTVTKRNSRIIKLYTRLQLFKKSGADRVAQVVGAPA